MHLRDIPTGKCGAPHSVTEARKALKRKRSGGRTVIVRMARDTAGTLADDGWASLSMGGVVYGDEEGGVWKEQTCEALSLQPTLSSLVVPAGGR